MPRWRPVGRGEEGDTAVAAMVGGDGAGAVNIRYYLAAQGRVEEGLRRAAGGLRG